MGATTKLTRAACDALEREARSQLDNSCGEYVLGLSNPDKMAGYADEHREMILGCAEIVGTLPRYWGDEESTAELAFSDEAQACLDKIRRETVEHVEDLDRSGDGDRAYNAGEVFLLHVLELVLGKPTMAGAV